MSISTTAVATSYHRRIIPLVVLILLSLTNSIYVVHGEQVHDHHVDEDNDHHGHEQEEHHHATVAPDEPKSDEVEAEASHVNEHDHSGHVHDETCNHDHAAASGDSTATDAEEAPPATPSHDHSHSHSHSHGRSKRPPPKLTPLMESIRDDDYDTFRKLLSDPSVDISHTQDDWPVTALMYTFVMRKYVFTEELLGAGVDVGIPSGGSMFEGIGPLKLALKTVKDEDVKFRLVNLLVDGGAEVEEDLQESYNELMQRGGVGGEEGEGEEATNNEKEGGDTSDEKEEGVTSNEKEEEDTINEIEEAEGEKEAIKDEL